MNRDSKQVGQAENRLGLATCIETEYRADIMDRLLLEKSMISYSGQDRNNIWPHSIRTRVIPVH